MITQTTDGYIWIGTQAGLVRFDGVRFVPFRPRPDQPLTVPTIVSLLGARDGSLWIGTASFLARWKDGNLFSYLNKRGYINEIRQSQDGAIWITRSRIPDGGGPLCRAEDADLQCYGSAQGFPLPFAGPLAKDSEGEGWWVANGGQLVHWNEQSSFIDYAPSGLKSKDRLGGFEVLEIGPDGSLWAGISGTGPGLGLQHRLGGRWQPLVAGGTDTSGLAVSALRFDRDHSLWVGTTNQGISRISNGEVDRFRSADGLSSNSVTRFYQDREGNMWVATSKGLDKFSDVPVVSTSNSDGLSSDNASSVLSAHDGTIWVGNLGALDAVRGRKVTSIDRRSGLPGRQITSLMEDRKGRLWVGIDDRLTVYSSGKFTPVTNGNGPTGIVPYTAEDPDGSIWASPISPPSRLLHITGLKVTEEIPAPPHKRIVSLATNPSGGIWVGFYDGDLASYRQGQWQIISLQRFGLKSPALRVIATPNGGVLGSTSEGLVGWQSGKSQVLTTGNGLPCNRIYSLIFDSRRALWLYTACGLVTVSERELQRWWRQQDARIEVRTFDILDGAQAAATPFQPGASVSPNGKVWFVNDRILQEIDPLRLSGNPVLPPVHIEKVIADRAEYPAAGELHLPALTRELEIDYTALSFVIPQRVRFRYKLDGWENEWRDAGSRRQAFYTNLRPGPYRFQVVACNDDGVWNNVGAALSFAIAPAYYQTAWFQTLCAGAFAGILWSLYMLRLKQATEQIQQRLSARLEERERIARELHDTLLQGFQGLMLRFQAVMKTLPAHEPAHRMIEEVLDRADSVLLEGRQRVRDLREEGLGSDELSKALLRCGEELGQGHLSAFSLAIAGTVQPLDPIVFNEVYRIAREALANAFQHSAAATIEADLTYSSNQVCLRIRDDGRGVDEQILCSGKAGHWGLSGMRERAEKIGARLKLWSRPGAGTEVEVIIPATVAYPRTRKSSAWLRVKSAMVGKGQA